MTSFTEGTTTFVQFFAFTYETIFFVDVVWATPGYILSCKLFDTHVRSAEPTFLGERSSTQRSAAQRSAARHAAVTAYQVQQMTAGLRQAPCSAGRSTFCLWLCQRPMNASTTGRNVLLQMADALL